MLTSCLLDCSASLLCTMMKLCTLENLHHEISVNYMCSDITVADVKIKSPAVSKVLERKLTCQFDFLWTRIFCCTKYSTVHPPKYNYMWAQHGSRHTVKVLDGLFPGMSLMGIYVAWNWWLMTNSFDLWFLHFNCNVWHWDGWWYRENV